MIEGFCPNCSAAFKFPDEAGGTIVACRHCEKRFQCPLPEERRWKGVWRWCAAHPYHVIGVAVLGFLVLNFVGYLTSGDTMNIRSGADARGGTYYVGPRSDAEWFFYAVGKVKSLFLFACGLLAGLVYLSRHDRRKQ